MIVLAAPVGSQARPSTHPAVASHPPGNTSLVSVAESGGSNAGISGRPSLDDAGDVAFTSDATLSPDDANAASDVYLRTASGVTRLISRTKDDKAGNGASAQPSISRNGRFIAFTSAATNVTTSGPAGTGVNQVLLYDRDPDGNGLDGKDYSIVTESVSNSGTAGVANGASDEPAVAVQGGLPYVAFRSAGSNLVNNDADSDADVFLRHAGVTTLVSSGVNGDQPNGSSADPAIAVTSTHEYIAFDSVASNLAGGDTNGFSDVFLRTVPQGSGTGTPSTVMVSFDGDGDSAHPSISSEGGRIVYASKAGQQNVPGSSHVYVSESPWGKAAAGGDVSQGEAIGNPVISGDGDYIAYEEQGRVGSFNGVGATSHRTIFLYRLSELLTFGVAASSSDAEPNNNSAEPSLAAHGTQIAFASTASNLVSGDANHTEDVFLRTRDATAPAAPTLSKASLKWSTTGRFTISTSDPGTLSNRIPDVLLSFGTSKAHSGLIPFETNLTSIGKSGVLKSSGVEVSCNFDANCQLLPGGRHYYLRARAIDAEGNLSPYAILGPFKIDIKGPKFSATSVTPRGIASQTFHFVMKATDSGTGLSHYDIGYDVTRPGNKPPGMGLLVKRTTAQSVTVHVHPGIFDFWVDAYDKLGNRSQRQLGRVTVPNPVTHVRFPASWTKVSSSAYYDGSAAVAKRKGAAFKLPQTSTQFIVVVAATACPTCGTVELEAVSKSGKVLKYYGVKKLNLHRSHTKHSAIYSTEFSKPDYCGGVSNPHPCTPAIAALRVVDISKPANKVAIEGYAFF